MKQKAKEGIKLMYSHFVDMNSSAKQKKKLEAEFNAMRRKSAIALAN